MDRAGREQDENRREPAASDAKRDDYPTSAQRGDPSQESALVNRRHPDLRPQGPDGRTALKADITACWSPQWSWRMIMQQALDASGRRRQREPWNKGKLIGAKPPLRPKHVWSIRSKLQAEGRVRDLAMFDLAIDSKLRGCDVIRLMVDDVAPQGVTAPRATVRQQKTGQPVRFELTEHTGEAVDAYLRAAGRRPGEFLFPGRGGGRCMTTRQYARLVAEWIAAIGLKPHL